jgi:RimJ/RimL family protein N-acetyltransferase
VAEEDFDDWVSVIESIAEEREWIATEPPIDRDLWRGRFDDMVSKEDRVSFLVLVDGAAVGNGGVIEDAPGLYELGMGLIAGYRGRGLGSMLMDEIIAWTRARPDAHKIALQVWPHNKAAIRLYEKKGFVQEGYLHKHYRRSSGELWDTILMGLPLDG